MFSKFDQILGRRHDGASAERRRADRADTNAGVQVRSMQGKSAAAVVSDVSPFGCSLVFDAPWRRMGMILHLTGARGHRIDAVVRWLDTATCGVEFLRPVADPEAALGSE